MNNKLTNRRETLALGLSAITYASLGCRHGASKSELTSRKSKKSNQKNIAIVGAGIAGLTCAYYLQRNGHKVTVYEKEPSVGGRMSHEYFGERPVDKGAQLIFPTYKTLLALIDEVGLSSELLTVTPYNSIVRNDKKIRIHSLKLTSLITSKLLKPNELSLRSLKGFLQLRKRLHASDARVWGSHDHQMAEEWARTNFGTPFLDYVANSLLGLSFHQAHEVSRARLIWILKLFDDSDKIMTLKSGMGTLPLKLSEKINVLTQKTVESVTRKNGKVTLQVDGQHAVFDRVIISSPAPLAKKIYAPYSTYEKELLTASYKPVLNFSFETKHKWQHPDRMQRDFALIFPPKTDHKTTAATFEYRDDSHLQRGFCQAFFQISPETQLWQEQNLLQDTALSEIKKYEGLSLSPENVLSKAIYRWQYAAPSQEIGRISIIRNYWDWIQTQIPHVILIGDYTGFYGTDGAAFTGKLAADAIS